ncbi:hypothetical protein BY996DRAFT_2919377 [Phakopsora pachyrhizi]|nr:hypothetical protein BY996DRAFT_2919377 [Phakopsora pachyrhizi]
MSSILKEVVMINRFNLSGLRQPNKPCQRLRELSTICPNRFPSTSSNRSQQNAPSNVETFPRKQKSSSYNDRLLVLGLLAVTGVTGIGLSSFGSQRRREKEKTVSADKRSDSEPELTSQSHEDELSPGDSAEQSAFNPETGEINWDCPCLGGMAHGVCGEQFKAAFSCFVYSDQEPKGVECIDKFKLMQDCFKDHPDETGTN